MSIHPAMRPVRRIVQCEGIVSVAMPCYNFEGGRFVQNYRQVPFQQSTERFLISPSQVLFHRPFIGGASVVAAQCQQRNLFNGDPSLISTYFMLRSA